MYAMKGMGVYLPRPKTLSQSLRGLLGLGQMDTSGWNVDPSTGYPINPSNGMPWNPVTDAPYDPGLDPQLSVAVDTSVLTRIPTVTASSNTTVTPIYQQGSSDSGSPLSDFFNMLTGAAQAATAVTSAADLIQINRQRAAMGYPPLTSSQGLSVTRSSALGVPPLVLYGGLGLLALWLLRR